jgi:hypothetical protein
MLRRLAWILALAACGSSSRATGDGGGEDAVDAPSGVPRCDAPATFDAGLTPTRTLHVGANAGAGGDGSAGAPFQTIEQAAAVATPGTAILLGPGMHANGQFVANLHGTQTAPIWIGGDPGQALPVIAGGAQALQLAQPNFVVVHDLEVSGATANGINIDDGGQFASTTAAQYVVVRGVFVHDIGTGGNNDCLKVSGINHLAVYDSRFERCGAGGSGVDHVGCHQVVIARNTFDGVMENAVQAKGGSTDIDIRQNRIRISGSRALNLGGSTDLNLFRPPLVTTGANAEARRIRAFNNIITGLGTSATAFAFVGCIDCLAAHNYVRGQQRWHLRILQETVDQGGYTFAPSGMGRVINNSFVFSAASLAVAVNVGGGTAPATFTFANNLWYASDTPAQSVPTLPVAEAAGIYGSPSAYRDVPDDPRAAMMDSICSGDAEAHQGMALPEVDGTVTGFCRFEPATIGPSNPESCSI